MSLFSTQIDNILVDRNLTLSFISENNEFAGSTPLLFCSGYLLGRIVIPNVKFVYQLSGNDKFGNPFIYTKRSINIPAAPSTKKTSPTDVPTIPSTDPPKTSSTDPPTTSSTDSPTTTSSTDPPTTTSSTDPPTTTSTDPPTTSSTEPPTTSSTEPPTTSSTDMPTTPPTRNPYALENVLDGSGNKTINIGSRASVYFGLISKNDATSVSSFNILATTSPTELMLKYKATITVNPNDTEIIIVTIETKDTDIPGSYVVTVTASSGDLILTNSQNVTLVKVRKFG